MNVITESEDCWMLNKKVSYQNLEGQFLKSTCAHTPHTPYEHFFTYHNVFFVCVLFVGKNFNYIFAALHSSIISAPVILLLCSQFKLGEL